MQKIKDQIPIYIYSQEQFKQYLKICELQYQFYCEQLKQNHIQQNGDIQPKIEADVKEEYLESQDKQPQLKIEEYQESNSQDFQETNGKQLMIDKMHVYPGETKNYYKNLGQKLAKFIQHNFHSESISCDSTIQTFIKIPSQKYNRMSIKKLLKSKSGRRIALYYFANYQWASSFLEQNKADLEFYLRHNRQIYCKKKQKNGAIK